MCFPAAASASLLSEECLVGCRIRAAARLRRRWRRARGAGGRLTLSGPGEVLAVGDDSARMGADRYPSAQRAHRREPGPHRRLAGGDIRRDGGPWLGPPGSLACRPAPSRPPQSHRDSSAAGPAPSASGEPTEAPLRGLRSCLAHRLRAGGDDATLHATGVEPESTRAAAAAMQAWGVDAGELAARWLGPGLRPGRLLRIPLRKTVAPCVLSVGSWGRALSRHVDLFDQIRSTHATSC